MGEPPLIGARSRAVADPVVGLGEISLDQLASVEAWPGPGSKLDLSGLETRPGGQMASALLGCARLGLRSRLIGAVGDDGAADLALAPLVAEAVDVSLVRRTPGAATRSAIILVREHDGERAILAHRDPALVPSRGDPERRAIETASALMLDVTDPDAALWAARLAREAGVPCVLDADRVWPGADALLPLVDFPVVAAGFAEEYGETGNIADGLVKLAGWGARLAVVTCGARGAMARAGNESLYVGGFAVQARDTTGAGDAFHAGFVWGLLRGLGTTAVLETANATAALNCLAAGAQEGLPDEAALEAFMRNPGCDRTGEGEPT